MLISVSLNKKQNALLLHGTLGTHPIKLILVQLVVNNAVTSNVTRLHFVGKI